MLLAWVNRRMILAQEFVYAKKKVAEQLSRYRQTIEHREEVTVVMTSLYFFKFRKAASKSRIKEERNCFQV